MTAAVPARLHHASGLPDYDAAAWTALPPLRGTLRGEEGWGVLLQDPVAGPDAFRPVEVEVPESTGVVLLLGLAAGMNEGRMSGTGAARPRRAQLRRGEALLLPPGIASSWVSRTGQERVLHVHLTAGFLAGVAAEVGLVARADLLPAGTLRHDETLDFLLRHVVRQLRHREPGWQRAIASAVTLATAQLLTAAAPRPRRRGAAAND